MKAETTTILLPRTVFEAGADKDIEFESTLADYLPNINRIIRADADVMCEDVQISGGKAEVNGKAVFTLLYESDFKQKLQCERFSTDFIQRFDLRDLPEGELIPSATAKCSFVGCKTLNPRRFILRCRADVGLEIKCMQGVQTVSMEDCKGAFFKSQKHKTACYTSQIVRDFNMEESVNLESLPPINDIIYTTLDFLPAELSLAEGSALIRGEVVLKCLYEPEGEDSALKFISRRLPAVFTVDDEELTAESDVGVSLSVRSIETEKEIDAYGENRVLQLRYGARVALSCVNRRELTVPTDMFFEEYVNENKSAALPYEEPVKDMRHRFSLEKVFEIPELAVESCMDLNVDIRITETTLTDEGISVKGNCGMNVFGLGADGYRAHDFSAAFSELVPFTAANKECRLKATAQAVNPVAELSGGRLSVRIPAELTLHITYKESLNALVSAEVEKRADSNEDSKPIIIYYPQKGETAWDIGRRYHTDPKLVTENNPDAFDKADTIAEQGTVLYM